MRSVPYQRRGLRVCLCIPLSLLGKTRKRRSRGKEDLLEVLFFMRPVLYQRKLDY
jgi:hypothetical protein